MEADADESICIVLRWHKLKKTKTVGKVEVEKTGRRSSKIYPSAQQTSEKHKSKKQIQKAETMVKYTMNTMQRNTTALNRSRNWQYFAKEVTVCIAYIPVNRKYMMRSGSASIQRAGGGIVCGVVTVLKNFP